MEEQEKIIMNDKVLERLKKDNPKLYMAYKTQGLITPIIEIKEHKEQNKSLPPLISQMVLTKLGLFCSERLSVDLYYLGEAINLLLPTMNQELLKKDYDSIYGEKKFDEAIRKLKMLNVLVVQSKTFYDALSDKSLTKRIGIIKSPNQNDEIVNKILKKYWHETSSKICLINSDLYNLFVFLIYNSPIQRQSIKAEYFKNLEQKDNRKINMDMGRRREEGGN